MASQLPSSTTTCCHSKTKMIQMKLLSMIKNVSIEQKFYDRCISQRAPQYGLVVSGPLNAEECVFLLLASDKESANFSDLDSISVNDLRSQCQKICRMLPAGPRVSGLYFCGAALPAISQSGNRIKEILSVIHEVEKQTLNDELIALSERDKVFLHVDLNSKKITGKAIGFENKKDFLRPVDVKIRSVIDRWRAIKTYIMLSVETYLPAERQKEMILEQLLTAVSPFIQAVKNNTRLLINGELKSTNDALFFSKSQKAAAKTGRQSKRNRDAMPLNKTEAQHHSCHWEPVNFTLFGPNFPCWHRTSSCSSIDSGHGSEGLATPPVNTLAPKEGKNLLIHGRIPGLAFLPVDGSTVADALGAFQRDLIHSILLRLDLLSEELHITSGELEVSRILLPQRALVCIPACPALPLSDYKFVSETPDDVVRRVAMFCRPLGSPRAFLPADAASGTDDVSPTSGEGSSDSEFNASEEQEYAEGGGRPLNLATAASGTFEEPAFNASCLDTRLERTFEGSGDDELSDVEIIADIEVIAQSVSKSKGKILIIAGAVLAVILGIIVTMSMDYLHV